MKYNVKLSPRQIDVLAYIDTELGGDFENTKAMQQAIADHLQISYISPVRDCLFSLRRKGYLQSRGGPISQPESWRRIDPSSDEPAHVVEGGGRWVAPPTLVRPARRSRYLA